MRAAGGTLLSLLNGNSVYLMADVFTVTLQNATVYRWTSADLDVSVGGNTFLSGSDNSSTVPGVRRGSIRHARGLEVQTLDLNLYSGSNVLVGGISLPLFAHNGGFDGATVKVERVFFANGSFGDTSAGTMVLFEGIVSDVEPETTKVSLKVKSDLERLNLNMPRVLFQPACTNVLGDAGCGVNLATYTVAGTATGVPTTTTVPSALAQAAGYFNLGILTMTSGAAAGARRAVSAFSGGLLTLATPLPQAPAAGDTFTVSPGCDRTTGASGCAKYSNLNRYRGCPYVPPPETTR